MATAPPSNDFLPVYPDLSPQNFRFVEIANIKSFLEKEVDSNLVIYKKYKKFLATIISCRYFFALVSVIFNALGIGSLSKVFEYELAIYFECASLFLELVTMMLFFVENKLMKKIEKHDEVHTLAASFLSTLMDYFSKALDNQNISQQELTTILNEHAKYLELRKAVRKKDFHQSDSQDLIKQFREKIVK